MFRHSLVIVVVGLTACQQNEPSPLAPNVPVITPAPASIESVEAEPAAEKIVPYKEFLRRVQTSPKTANALFDYLDKDMTDYWDDTTWDFYGMSRVPGEGEIACGYFVTTLLKDLGFDIDRIRLAQEPSGVMIEELTVGIKKSNSLHQTLESIRKGSKNAIYIVGLDFHTCFISHSEEGTFFIHSDYNDRRGVVREPAVTSLALSQSGFFMIGNLTDSESTLGDWRER